MLYIFVESDALYTPGTFLSANHKIHYILLYWFNLDTIFVPSLRSLCIVLSAEVQSTHFLIRETKVFCPHHLHFHSNCDNYLGTPLSSSKTCTSELMLVKFYLSCELMLVKLSPFDFTLYSKNKISYSFQQQ